MGSDNFFLNQSSDFVGGAWILLDSYHKAFHALKFFGSVPCSGKGTSPREQVLDVAGTSIWDSLEEVGQMGS